MQCPYCKGQTQPTYEGPQQWCRRCGALIWINADGTVRRYAVPTLAQQASSSEMRCHEKLLVEYRREHVCHCSQHDLERTCLWCRVDMALNSEGGER